MEEPELYRGHWPKNVSKTAKYGVKIDENKWKITVLLSMGGGMKAMIVEGSHHGIVKKVNDIKLHLGQGQGGVFYINEYKHLLVPVKESGTSYYYYGGKVDADFRFEFEGETYTTKPQSTDGSILTPGDKWVGPRPGIPYFLTSDGSDINYRTQVLTDDTPPKLRKGVTKTSSLKNEIGNTSGVMENISMVRKVKGLKGGRFYVNENRAVFAPVNTGDGDGWNYLFCGILNMDGWFPDPFITQNDE